MQISEKRIQQIFSNFKGKTIAVIGDLMIDRYFWGSVTRISPEAPVPVVEVENESIRLGGAANVSNNIRALGGIPLIFGVIGDDQSGKMLIDLSKELNFDTEGILIDESRPTTVKTRVIAHNQHVVRIDRENRTEISKNVQNNFIKILESKISSIDGIIFEDYNKGVVCKELIKNVIILARKHNKIITVDPKFNNFLEYKNVTVFKPNRKETEEALGMKLTDENSIINAGNRLREILHAENILITRGEFGMSVLGNNGEYHNIPTTARKVADVSGAGDTVISTLTMSIVAGADIIEAATIANTAGGIVCGEVGIVPINIDELCETLIEDLNNQ